MRSLSFRVAHDEIVSLLNESAEEAQTGEAHAAVSLLLEAQFALGDMIQHQLNKLQDAPPLSPAADLFAYTA